MKPKVAKLWIEALESGSYRQVKGYLKAPKGEKAYGHCCLGVLCDVYAKETGKGEWKGSKGAKAFVGATSSDDTELPEEVRVWAGMQTDCGKLPVQESVSHPDGGARIFENLVQLNDDADYNFKKIAKVIKQHSKGL